MIIGKVPRHTKPHSGKGGLEAEPDSNLSPPG